jgi:hypothetical protein
VTISSTENEVWGGEGIVWSIYSMDGKLYHEGASNVIECEGIAVGSYVVLITSESKISRLPLQIIN